MRVAKPFTTSVFFVVSLVISLLGCKEGDTYSGPYQEIELYHLSFDDLNDQWFRYPLAQAGKDSCVFAEDGLLKMIIRPGNHGCGGCAVGFGSLYLRLEDDAAKHPEVLDRFGLILKVARGNFQTIEHSYDSFDSNGEPAIYMQRIKYSRLFLNYNVFSLSLPASPTVYYNDTNFDLTDNLHDAQEYHLVYDRGEKHIYIDGVEQVVENVQLNKGSGANNWSFKLQLNLERHALFQNEVVELHIDDLRLYTWHGVRSY